MVLTHLILNDMMKVRSHISRLALCLQDSEPRIASLAQLFFHELSNKAFKVSSVQPIFSGKLTFLSDFSLAVLVQKNQLWQTSALYHMFLEWVGLKDKQQRKHLPWITHESSNARSVKEQGDDYLAIFSPESLVFEEEECKVR